jgi:hypothetical protein
MNMNRMNMNHSSRTSISIDGDTQGIPNQMVDDDDNASNTVWDERDATIPSGGKITTGKITTEKLHSCEDMFESTLMDRKPSALPNERISCEAKPMLQHARSQPCLEQSGQEYSQRISSYSRHESQKNMLHRPRPWDRFQVELLPGHFVPLIGSEETWQAFCADNVIDIECSSCETFLYCKNTAEMVLCPGCRMISPIDKVGVGAEGLGLGLTVAAAFDMLG